MNRISQRETIPPELRVLDFHPAADASHAWLHECLPFPGPDMVCRNPEPPVNHGVIPKLSSGGLKKRRDADTVFLHHWRCGGCGWMINPSPLGHAAELNWMLYQMLWKISCHGYTGLEWQMSGVPVFGTTIREVIGKLSAPGFAA